MDPFAWTCGMVNINGLPVWSIRKKTRMSIISHFYFHFLKMMKMANDCE